MSLMSPSIELLLVIVCACVPTLKPIYNYHFRRRRTQQQQTALLPALPLDRSKRQSHYRPLGLDQNDDPAISLSSFPRS